MVAITATSLLSAIATASSVAFVTWRLIFWRRYFTTYIGYNQYIILIYNLLIADLLQAAGFLISFHWIRTNSINDNKNLCFTQGLILQMADPSSGLFVLAIAVHTFVNVFLGHKLRYRVFVACVIGLWMFCLSLAIIPPAIYGLKAYDPSGPWVRSRCFLEIPCASADGRGNTVLD
jgi:hypothetical protein